MTRHGARRDAFRALVAAAAFAGLFVALAHPPWPLWPLAALDASVLEWFQQLRTPRRDAFFGALTRLGDRNAVAAATGAMALALLAARRFREAVALALCVLATAYACVELKVAYERARPLAPANLSSFPSAHAALAAVAYVSIAFLAVRRFRRRILAAIAIIGALVLAAAIGVSRLYLGAHWLSDVLAGHALGFLAFCLLVSCTQTLRLAQVRDGQIASS